MSMLKQHLNTVVNRHSNFNDVVIMLIYSCFLSLIFDLFIVDLTTTTLKKHLFIVDQIKAAITLKHLSHILQVTIEKPLICS